MREVTPEWLTGALRRGGTLRDARVVGVELDLIGNFSNQLWRLDLRYDRAETGAPDTVVLKRSRSDRPLEAGQRLADEIRFYAELGGALPVRAPRFHFGAEASERAVLVMEHVDGLAPVDWRRGAGPEHGRLAMRELARLHAHFDGGLPHCDWIPSFADPAHRAALGESYDRVWAAKRDFFRDRAPAFAEIGDALAGRVGPTLAPLGEPETLLHGDAHFENLVLVDGGGERSILFHDWAGARRGAASLDVAVFAVMSYPPERRPGVERELVDLHAAALEAAGSRAPSDPWRAYRLGALAWSVRLAHFMQPFPRGGEPETGPGEMVLERCAAAPVDLAAGDLIA